MLLLFLIPVVLSAPTNMQFDSNSQYPQWPQPMQQNPWQQNQQSNNYQQVNNQIASSWNNQQAAWQPTSNNNQQVSWPVQNNNGNGAPSQPNTNNMNHQYMSNQVVTNQQITHLQGNKNIVPTQNYQPNQIQNIWPIGNQQTQNNVQSDEDSNESQEVWQPNESVPSQQQQQQQLYWSPTQNKPTPQDNNLDTQQIIWLQQMHMQMHQQGSQQESTEIKATVPWPMQKNGQQLWMQPNPSNNINKFNNNNNNVNKFNNNNNNNFDNNQNNIVSKFWPTSGTTGNYFPNSEESVESGKCEAGQFGGVVHNPVQFKTCDSGHWVVRNCAPGTYFDSSNMACSAIPIVDAGSPEDSHEEVSQQQNMVWPQGPSMQQNVNNQQAPWSQMNNVNQPMQQTQYPNPAVNPWQQVSKPMQAFWLTKPTQPEQSIEDSSEEVQQSVEQPSPEEGTNSKNPILLHSHKKCPSGTRRTVFDNEDAFEVCDNGEWVFMLCAPGTWFSSEYMECTDGYGPAPSMPMPQNMVDEFMKNRVNGIKDGDKSDEESEEKNKEKSEELYLRQYMDPSIQQMNGMEMRMVEINGKFHIVPTSMLNQQDITEITVVSVEKCKVGSTREDSTPEKYQECIINPKDITTWIRRNCAPGTLYSPWTKNCGKYDGNDNYTDVWALDNINNNADRAKSAENSETGSRSNTGSSEEIQTQSNENNNAFIGYNLNGFGPSGIVPGYGGNYNNKQNNGYFMMNAGHTPFTMNGMMNGNKIDENSVESKEKNNRGKSSRKMKKMKNNDQQTNMMSFMQNYGSMNKNLNSGFGMLQPNVGNGNVKIMRTQTITDKNGKKITISFAMDGAN